MTTVAPNPHSPYASADSATRHIFPSPLFFGDPAPGVLALTACEGMAVVPEGLVETEPGAPLPDGLCPACVTVMQGGEPPKRQSSQCGECDSPTWHGALCALCRQEKHEAWWPTRNEHLPAWVDGDPLMEAIANAVYERCETGDGGIVHDDPRNIAAAAAVAVRALQVAEVQPAAELLALATVLEIPRPDTSIPLQLRLSHGHTDRWAICDREGRRWHREHGWVYESQGIRDEPQRGATRYTLAEAVPLARKLAAGEQPS